MVSSHPTNLRSSVIAFCGGGTGGHLYPALAIADALARRVPGARFLFFGTERPLDRRIINRPDCELIEQQIPPLRLAPWRWPGMLSGLHRTHLLCRSRLERDRPAVVIGTGGLGSLAGVREAFRAGIPTVLLNPDAVAGRANRHLAGMADLTIVQWEETLAHFKRRFSRSGASGVARRMPRQFSSVQVCGCAIRPEFTRAERSVGMAHFGLDPDRRTLLVTGASQGARTINQAVLANLDVIESARTWQILHLTGELDYDAVRRAYEGSSVRASVVSFTDRMADALAAADLVLSRAGASTLAEITALGKPSILMPYPFHRDMHQLANARCLARVLAARIVNDAANVAINGPALGEALRTLLFDDEKRASMADAARRLGRGGATDDIADEIVALMTERGTLHCCESLEKSCTQSR